uniref:TF-B3 domain-containing protein n=1 Tax=Leersia perrieri TaxID=77586 RepID=A0A0D9V3U1_9ORYZ
MVPAVGDHRFPAEPLAPAWIRGNLLPSLGLPSDSPLHFIGEKAVTASDLSSQQGRFFLPTGMRPRLVPLLSTEERNAADLQPDKVPGAAGVGEEAATKKVPANRGGKEGASVMLAARRGDGAGEDGFFELKLKRWEASDGAVIKGKGYSEFFRGCGFRQGDAVEIWAFRRSPTVRLFGEDLQLAVLPLNIVIAKRDDQRWQQVPAVTAPVT